MNREDESILCALQEGKIVVQGEFLWGSNYTFLVEVQYDGQTHQAVYKPARGERPLWDFPTASLCRREVAAFLLSSALGWDLVPPTVYRKKGPIGGGSLQWFIEHDPNYHYFNFSKEDRERLRPTVLFDLLINNADRKGSHILKDPHDHFWLIDHGVCFHVEDKLRTVIWDFMGEPIPDDLCEDIRLMRRKLGMLDNESSGVLAELQQYISPAELRALAKRADDLIISGRFPEPDPYRRPFPWPQL
jgi:uncharacterized repeat protein (TIGR03843 family)